MGRIKAFFNHMVNTWRGLSTEQKVGVVIDAMCNIGGGMIGSIAGQKLSEGKSLPERMLIRTTTFGLGIAAGDISAKCVREEYGEVISGGVDHISGMIRKKKEESAHE